MSKQIAFVLTGLTLAMSSVGCCCLSGYGYGAGYGCNRCAPCNNGCPPAGGVMYAPQGAMYQSYDAASVGYVSGATTTAVVPSSAIIGTPGGYTTTALIPANSLPTY